MKKILSIILTAAMLLTVLVACGNSAPAATAAPETEAAAAPETEAAAPETEPSAPEAKSFKVGICNYVKDASLDQIVENVEAQLNAIAEANGVTIEILEDNCMADAATMEQIISNFIAEKVDLMIGVATPVAMRMQAMTEDNQIPVVFSAVSDPLAAGLVESLEAPGANVTGTSDYLNTNALLDLVFAANPDTAKVGLLYDLGQDSSTTPIAAAKAYLDAKGIEYVEATGTTTDEVKLAADKLIAAGVDAVFTPTDNTIMTAELAIYEKFAEAGIPHYCGADSFALNGAFAGYGVDYANLGKETANMAAEILLNGAAPATLPAMTFDNGTCTVNTEICEQIGLDFAAVEAAFSPLCTEVKTITTAESFADVAG